MTGPNWERGDWMQTFTGIQFFPMKAEPEDIDIRDIAHALSNVCRYGGHVKRFYSVAEHSVILSNAVDHEFALWALLHDAAEAYIGDMVRPLKRNMPDYQAVEDRLIAVIAERFDLEGSTIPDEVKDFDNRILLDERAALLGRSPVPWHPSVEDAKPLGVPIEALPNYRAEYEFGKRFDLIHNPIRLSTFPLPEEDD